MGWELRRTDDHPSVVSSGLLRKGPPVGVPSLPTSNYGSFVCLTGRVEVLRR